MQKRAHLESKPAPAAAPGRREPRWLRPALLALAAVCLLGLFSTEITDSDFWWQLRTGQYLVEQRALPSPDPFSFTSNLGAPAYAGEERTRYFNLTHEWLAQVLWYLIYAAGGFPAVVLFKAFLLAGFCGLVGLVAGRRTASFYAGMAAAFAAAALASLFTADRPALISFFLVAAFVAILEFRRRLWLLPVLSLIWANCHGGFFLGWVVLAAYSVEAFAGALRKRPIPDARRIWIFSAISVLVSGLNPNFFRVVETLGMYRKSYLTSTLIEWSRPPLWGPPYSFDLLLYAAAAVLLIAWRKVRTADWFLFAAFSAAALLSFRNILLVAAIAPVMIAAYFPWRRKLPAFTGAVAAAALAAFLATGIARGRFFQLRYAEWKFPVAAADFLLANKITAPLFNTYEYGGYLMWRLWPQQRVFIDGRALNESVYQDYRRLIYNFGAPITEVGKDRQELLARYGIGAIVINSFEYVSGAIYPFALALGNPNQKEWKLVFEDPQAMVFLREPPPGMPVIDNARVVDHLEAECSAQIEKDPELTLCARTLGQLFLNARDYRRARRALGLYLSHPHDPDPAIESAYRDVLLK